jgi:hypothetical protein
MTTTTRDVPPDECATALATATDWRLLALLFERPHAGWGAEAAALGRAVQDAALAPAAAAAAEASAGTYLRLLGPGGGISPREVAYRGREDPGALLADIAAFYRAFAFHPCSEDPPDHVAVEAAFVGYLWLKEAYALACGDAGAAAISATARARFVEAHLRYFAAPLAERLAGAGVEYLAAASRALAERCGPAPTSAWDASDEAGDAPMGCAGCPEVRASGG